MAKALHDDERRGGTHAPGHYDGDGCTFPTPGHYVRNMSAEEYALTYESGEPHPEPPSLAELQQATAEGQP